MNFSFRQRYMGILPDDSGGVPVGTAPLTIAPPCMYAQTDYAEFRCNAEQKGDKIAAKMRYKLFLKKHGIDWKKELNIPQNRIGKVKL